VPSLRTIRRVYKPLVWTACLAPLAWLVGRATGLGGLDLGPNPVEAIQDTLGIWGLRMMLLTLAITPLRRIIGAPWPLQFRRMLGLFTLFYAGLHFLTYVLLDQTLDMALIIEDIVKRPFITLGFTGLLLLVPLAVTSTSGWRRRLGRRWQRLHRFAYLIAILMCWHYYWQVKQDVTEPLAYSGTLGLLLAVRLKPGPLWLSCCNRVRRAARYPALRFLLPRKRATESPPRQFSE